VARIEVIRGPGAVQYGSAGMGGVVNVITKRATDNAMFAEASGGSFDTAKGSIGGSILSNGVDFSGPTPTAPAATTILENGEQYHNTGIN